MGTANQEIAKSQRETDTGWVPTCAQHHEKNCIGIIALPLMIPNTYPEHSLKKLAMKGTHLQGRICLWDLKKTTLSCTFWCSYEDMKADVLVESVRKMIQPGRGGVWESLAGWPATVAKVFIIANRFNFQEVHIHSLSLSVYPHTLFPPHHTPYTHTHTFLLVFYKNWSEERHKTTLASSISPSAKECQR